MTETDENKWIVDQSDIEILPPDAKVPIKEKVK